MANGNLDCLTHTQASKKCQDDDDESGIIEMGEDGSYDSTQQKTSKAEKNTTAMPNEEQVKDKEEDSGLQRTYEL